MPYKLSSYIENRVLFVKYWDVVTFEDVRTSMQNMTDYLAQSEEPIVHIINDVGDVTQSLPLSDAMEASREASNVPQNMGWTIIIREKNKVSKFISSMAASLFSRRLRYFDTLAEAKVFLANMDSTLVWESAKELEQLNE